jgi:ABC-2 type transport system permease protein
MAGLGTAPATELTGSLSSRRHFATIAWLRWRIFVNSLRGKGATGELVVKIISYPFLALIILGPSVGAGIGSYYLVSKDMVSLLAIPLWIIFALWQFIAVNTSTTAPSFDLSSLIRFPIRYRDYLLIRLSFGLLDPPTLAGLACLFAMSVGITIAAPELLPWAAFGLVIYAVCNILFSRMVYSWMERWLAQRRTRELLTGVILAASLGAQFVAQYAQRLGTGKHHTPSNPLLLKAAHILVSINWLLPPGLTAASIDHFHRGVLPVAVAALGGLILYTTAFLLILHLRLYAEYRGENLSEAPAASAKAKPTSAKQSRTSAASVEPRTAGSLAFLPATVAACLIKEIRYLLRSGPKLYVLIMPVFIVFLFSMRTSGLNYAGLGRHGLEGMLFTYGCAYTQLIFVGLIYNSMGGDGAGVQFYYIAPARMRDVMLAKNLLIFVIFAIEAVLVYIVSALVSSAAPVDLTAATLAWSLFTLLLSMSIGNVRSITSPKAMDPAKVRSQNVNGLSSLISLVVVAASVGLGTLVFFLCRYLHTGYWIAVAIFSVLAALAFVLYMGVLRQLDGIAAKNVEDLTKVLGKA